MRAVPRGFWRRACHMMRAANTSSLEGPASHYSKQTFCLCARKVTGRVTKAVMDLWLKSCVCSSSIISCWTGRDGDGTLLCCNTHRNVTTDTHFSSNPWQPDVLMMHVTGLYRRKMGLLCARELLCTLTFLFLNLEEFLYIFKKKTPTLMMSYGSHLACFRRSDWSATVRAVTCMQQQMYSAGHSLSGSSDRRDAPVCCFPAAADTRLPLGVECLCLVLDCHPRRAGGWWECRWFHFDLRQSVLRGKICEVNCALN